MDKNREMKIGMRRREIKGQKLFAGLDGVDGGEFVPVEKSKKARVRKLSVVGKVSSIKEEDCEMGFDESERDDENRSQSPLKSGDQRFMVPKKFFVDCNGVDHASVPRKLRSVIKRSLESISPPSGSKKANNSSTGVTSNKNTGRSKFKLNLVGRSDWSQKQNDSGSITKDEEEVAETLYALAGMFPSKDEGDACKLDVESLDANSSAPPVASETYEPASKESKEDMKSVGQTSEVANLEGLPGETVMLNSLKNSIMLEQPDLADNRQLYSGADSSVPKVNCNNIRLASETEPITEKTLGNGLNVSAVTVPIVDVSSWKESKQQEMLYPERKLDLTLMAGTAANPVCLDIAPRATGNSSFETGLSTDKVSKVNSAQRSLKRCTAHVYISHLIRDLQIKERGGKLSLPTNQVKQNEGPDERVHIAANSNGAGNSSNGVMTTSNIQSSSTNKNLKDGNNMLQNNRLYQEQQQAALASRAAYALQKQSFNFLSLRADGGGMEANSGVDRAGEGLQPLSQHQVPNLHSLTQHQNLMPFSTPRTHYSSAFPNQLSAAGHQVQLQLPPYLGIPPFNAPYSNPKASVRQQQQHQFQQLHQLQQQKQQRLWVAQLAGQYRPVQTSTAMTQLQNWQNGRQDSPVLTPCSEAVVAPPSSQHQQQLMAKTSPSSQHQQQLMAKTSSFIPGRLTMQNHHLPSAREESGHGFHAGGSMPLQLLCNDRL